MMTRKHFQEVANMIRAERAFLAEHETKRPGSRPEWHEGYAEAVESLEENLADFFAAENPNFDRDRFFAATQL